MVAKFFSLDFYSFSLSLSPVFDLSLLFNFALFRESDPGLIGIDGATETEGKAHFVIPFRGVLGKLKLFGFVPLFLAAKAEEAEEAVNLCLKALRKIPKSVTSTPDSKREKFFRRFNVSATTRRSFSSIAFATNTERRKYFPSRSLASCNLSPRFDCF